MCDLTNKRIVITGGSGFLGTSMTAFFTNLGSKVTIVSRNRPKLLPSNSHWQAWDGQTAKDWTVSLDGADAIVNLAGRSVNCVKTPDHQDQILRSRVDSTRVISLAIRQILKPPPVWIQMSTAHIYGDPPAEICTEDSATGIGFAPMIGKAWEAAFHESCLPNQRGVIMRTSFVIGRDRGAGGGALGTLSTLARFGLGGRVGHGRQGMSWIHETDLNRLFARAITSDEFTGTYIATAPDPVPQVEFMRKLRQAIRMPIGLPATETMVRMGASLLLRTDPELALYGRYLVPKRLQQQSFDFTFPTLLPALRNLCR